MLEKWLILLSIIFLPASDLVVVVFALITDRYVYTKGC